MKLAEGHMLSIPRKPPLTARFGAVNAAPEPHSPSNHEPESNRPVRGTFGGLSRSPLHLQVPNARAGGDAPLKGRAGVRLGDSLTAPSNMGNSSGLIGDRCVGSREVSLRDLPSPSASSASLPSMGPKDGGRWVRRVSLRPTTAPHHHRQLPHPTVP